MDSTQTAKIGLYLYFHVYVYLYLYCNLNFILSMCSVNTVHPCAPRWMDSTQAAQQREISIPSFMRCRSKGRLRSPKRMSFRNPPPLEVFRKFIRFGERRRP